MTMPLGLKFATQLPPGDFFFLFPFECKVGKNREFWPFGDDKKRKKKCESVGLFYMAILGFVKNVGRCKRMYEIVRRCKLQFKSYIKRNEIGP